MRKFHNSVLKENIRELIKQHDTTITKLAEDIGMEQSNMSKRLSPSDDSTRFTLDQVYAIAERFDVSIDELLGHKVFPKQAPIVETCHFLVRLLETHQIRILKHERNENYYQPPFIDQHEHVTYNAFYFPDYVYVEDAVDDDSAIDLRQDIDRLGNSLPDNQKINDFLNHYIDIRDRHDIGQYSDENYQILLDAYYKMLES